MTAYDQIKDTSDIVLGDAHDKANHAVRVTGTFTIGEVIIDCLDDSIAIGDAVTGETADVVDGKLQVSAEVSVAIPDDYRTKTITVTGSVTAINFSGFDVKAIAIRALDENPGYVRLGKSNILTSSDEFFLMEAGDALNITLTETTVPIYHVIDPGAPSGVYKLTVIATN